MKNKKVLIIGIVLVCVFGMFFFINSFKGIRGSVFQVIQECGTDDPVLIMKTIGVKKIHHIKESKYSSKDHKQWEVTVDDGKIIELDYESYIGWTLKGTSYKKINEIDNRVDDDSYVYYYNSLHKYVTNLNENKVILFSEIEKQVRNEKINILERFSGIVVPTLPYLFGLFIILYVFKRRNYKKNIKEQKFLSENDALFVVRNVFYNDGILHFIRGELCHIFVQKTGLRFVDLKSQNSAELSFSQIVACGVFTDQQIQEQTVVTNGNVIGRGVLGGFIFGPAGLILGGMSGIGAKTTTVRKTSVTYFFILNYVSSTDQQVKSISFQSNCAVSELKQLSEIVNHNIIKKKIQL